MMLSRILIVLLAASALPAAAQVDARPAPAAPAEAPRKKPSCPCEKFGYTPLNEKGKAVAEYWSARRKAKISTVVSGLALIFGYAAGDVRTVHGAADSYGTVRAELDAKRARAIELKALRVSGDDLDDDGVIEFLIKPGVDYELKR